MRSLLKQSGYGITAGFLQVSRLGSTLLAASLLGPEVFSPWLLITSIISYSMFAQLGVTNGLYRELPVALGAGDQETANILFVTGRKFLLWLSVVLLALLVTFCFFCNWRQPQVVILLSVFLVLVNQFYTFQLAVSHSYFNFRRVTIHMGAFAFLLPILTWYGVYWAGLSGFLLAQTGLMFISILFLGNNNPRASATFSRAFLRLMIRTGIPISLAGLFFSILTSMDRWVISHYMGKQILGQYALAVFCVNSLALLTKMISPQFYSRMSFLFGETGDVTSLRKLVFSQFWANMLVMVTIAFFFWLFVEPAVHQWMPAYLPGIAAARMVMLGVVFLGCVNPFAAMMNASGNNRAYLIVQIVGLLGLFSLLIFSVKVYGSLWAVSVATAAGYCLYMFMIVGTGLYVLYRRAPIIAEPMEAKMGAP